MCVCVDSVCVDRVYVCVCRYLDFPVDAHDGLVSVLRSRELEVKGDDDDDDDDDDGRVMSELVREGVL